MLFRKVTTALFAVAFGALAAEAQGVRDIPAPRENPPAGFTGQQYVDSRGCVFMKAGFDGQTRWVPRVGNDRKVLCGYPPTYAQVREAPDPRVAPQPTANLPVETVAVTAMPAPVRTASPAASAPPASSYVPAPVALAAAPRAVPVATGQATTLARTSTRAGGCPASAPVAERVPLRGGGTAILCVTHAGQLSDRAVAVSAVALAPQRQAPSGAAVRTELVCPGWAPAPRRFTLTDGGTTTLCTRGDGTLDGLTAPVRRAAGGGVVMAASGSSGVVAPAMAAQPVVPPGYRLAWKDDRLNPNRAQGTAAGQYAQDQIWTRETPARLVADTPQARRQTAQVSVSTKAAAPQPQVPRSAVRVSTKSDARAAVPAQPAGRAYVQVGTFGQPSNADGARARLTALGLPVSAGRITSGGKALQVIYAGPFADAGQAQAALTAARRAGFSDAFLK